MEMNPVLDKLPKHLLKLVIDQPYENYTAQDHAVWRYVMRQNTRYLPKVAHHSYLEGLRKTGISVERIPHIYGMNRILSEIGWAAVTVDGFIPPAAFMEFQAYNILVIAADIRAHHQIEYTPAPDIIHEAAGHAPIIADPQYAEYLKLFGEIGSKAFSSANDYKIYEAIRHLSILKADPYSKKKSISKAEEKLATLEMALGPVSEMALIRNLHWWTVEYGLIGDLNDPKIYGAGLLSSIGESFTSLQPEVKKIPYTIEAINYNFDITTRQPQLFVTPDFQTLTNVLNEFRNQMALSRGGSYGLKMAIETKKTATAVYSSGLQVSGQFTHVSEFMSNAVYFKTTGPTNLNYNNKQLEGHGKEYHLHGFGSPIGKLKGVKKPVELLTDHELLELGIVKNKPCDITFESGVQLSGTLKSLLREKGKILLMTFSNCKVEYEGKVLFDPDWGVFDMAVGEKIISVYSGPADPEAFGLEIEPPKEKTHKINYDSKSVSLHKLYEGVREVRNGTVKKDLLNIAFSEILTKYNDDWLLSLEILELLKPNDDAELIKQIENYLSKKVESEKEIEALIENGLKLLN
jgi:phenylalanine-4-hydroxylase